MPLLTRARAAATVALVASGLVLGAGPARAAATYNVLLAGHTVSSMRSASGEFELNTSGNSMELSQYIGSYGLSVWGTPAKSLMVGRANLTMQYNGDLVLRTKSGVAQWHSGTAGTGSRNRLVLLDYGDLVVYTATGRAVWSSRSGRAMLKSGAVLASGHALSSRYTTATPLVNLVMERNGNLVLGYGGHARWSSHTFVAGSRLVGWRNGNWAIVTPAGKVVWTAGAGVGSATFLSVLPAGRAADLQVYQIATGRIPFERIV